MLTLFAEAIGDATTIIGRVGADHFHRPTPCSAWDLQQLLTHMIGELDGFTEAVSTGAATADRFVRDPVPIASVLTDWTRSATALQRAFRAAAPESIIKLSDYGALPVGVVLGMQLLDTAVHSWDVASTLNIGYRPSDPIVAAINESAHRIAARDHVGPAFGPAVAEPIDGSDDWAEALRLLGRDPQRPTAAPARIPASGQPIPTAK